MSKHTKPIVGLVALTLIAGAVGWLAGSTISSPAEIAARTGPPKASPILVPAEMRVLSSDIVTRGTARFESPQQLYLTSSTLKLEIGIASGLPVPGKELRDGGVVMTVSGRPVFLLVGTEPSFRDIGPGSQGEDVLQLEKALRRFGFDPGPVDGSYDEATGSAVRDWYQSEGFAPFQALASSASQVELIAAQEAVVSAQANLQATRNARTRAADAADGAKSAVSTAKSRASANNLAAEADVALKQATLDNIRAQGSAESSNAFLIAAAQAELDAAKAAVEVIRADGQAEVAAATEAQKNAEADAARLSNEIKSAEQALANANALFALRKQQSETTGSEANRFTTLTGFHVPSDEIIFVPNTPVRVSEISIRQGEPAIGAVMTVTSSGVAVDGAFRLGEAPLAAVGMKVEIDEVNLNIKETGVISRIADAPGTNGVDGFHVWFEVLVDGSPASLVGTSVRLIVPVESTGGEVLVVPISALTLASDGSSRVQRQHNDQLEFVTVEPGFSAQGYVQVTPVDGELHAGDLVVVGFDQPVQPPESEPPVSESPQVGITRP